MEPTVLTFFSRSYTDSPLNFRDKARDATRNPVGNRAYGGIVMF